MRLLIECTETFIAKNHHGISRVVRNIANQAVLTTAFDKVIFLAYVKGKSYEIPIKELLSVVEKPDVKNAYNISFKIYNYIKVKVAQYCPFKFVETFLYAPKSEFGLSYIVDLLILRPIRSLRKSMVKVSVNYPEVLISRDDTLFLVDSGWVNNTYNLAANAKLNGAKIIALCYDIIPIIHPEYCVSNLAFRLFKPWFDKVIKECDMVLSISDYTKWAVEKYLQFSNKDKKIKVNSTLLGFSLDQSFKETIDRKNMDFVDKHRDNYYLMVGTIEIRKNHVFVLNNFEFLKQSGIEAPVVIIGAWGWDFEAFKLKLEKSNCRENFFIFKNISDFELIEFYKNAKALIFASYSEGFGLPLIEAAAYGLPILASNTLINKEVVGHDGIYFDLQNPFSLAEKIRDIENGKCKLVEPNIKIKSWTECWNEMEKYIIEFTSRIDDDFKGKN